MKIFVDLDGVLIDFVTVAMRMCGAYVPENEYPENCGWDILKATNIIRDRKGLTPISKQYFWDGLDYGFWRSLKCYPGAREFVNTLESYGEVFFATSPTLSSECVAGKYDWVKDHFPDYRRKLIIATSKHVLADEESVLIDDRDRNCSKFISAGGRAILVPRPWNILGHTPYTYNFVYSLLRTIAWN